MRPFGLLTTSAWDDGYATGKHSSGLEIETLQTRIKELEEALELYARADIDVRKSSTNIYELFELDNGKYQRLGTKAHKLLEKESD